MRFAGVRGLELLPTLPELAWLDFSQAKLDLCCELERPADDDVIYEPDCFLADAGASSPSFSFSLSI